MKGDDFVFKMGLRYTARHKTFFSYLRYILFEI